MGNFKILASFLNLSLLYHLVLQ